MVSAVHFAFYAQWRKSTLSFVHIFDQIPPEDEPCEVFQSEDRTMHPEGKPRRYPNSSSLEARLTARQPFNTKVLHRLRVPYWQ